MTNTEYKKAAIAQLDGKKIFIGEKVWLKMPMIDEDMEVQGIVVKVNAKTIRCYSETRGCEGNYKPENVSPRD